MPATMNVPHSTRSTRTPATRAACALPPMAYNASGRAGGVAQKQAEHDVQDRGDPDGHGDAYPLAGAEIQIPTWKGRQTAALPLVVPSCTPCAAGSASPGSVSR